MKIDFGQELLDLKGQAIKDGNDNLILATVCCGALLTPYADEQNIDSTEKVRRYRLATKIFANGRECEMSIEDIAEIKKLVGKAFPPLIVGRVFEIIDPS